MNETWHTFPASMGEHLAWITYNHDFSETIDSDPRETAFLVQIKLKDPTDEGLPTKEEFAELQTVEEAFGVKLNELGGIYAGRLTVAGTRVLYYYVHASTAGLKAGLETLNDLTDYELGFSLAPDPDKERFWNELFPTNDDWQVIQDMKTLELLAKTGDDPNTERDIIHTAYFKKAIAAEEFRKWAETKGYVTDDIFRDENDERFGVKFESYGTLRLGDITSHTIVANRKAIELDGEYDGWETRQDNLEIVPD
jgi:hypothetical protein